MNEGANEAARQVALRMLDEVDWEWGDFVLRIIDAIRDDEKHMDWWNEVERAGQREMYLGRPETRVRVRVDGAPYTRWKDYLPDHHRLVEDRGDAGATVEVPEGRGRWAVERLRSGLFAAREEERGE